MGKPPRGLDGKCESEWSYEKYMKTKKLKDDKYDPTYGNIAFVARIDFDFHQETHIYEYFGMADLVSKLGGIGASLKIMLGSFTIFFCF